MTDEAPSSSPGPRLVKNVCFIGAGFVGATSAAVFAWFCIDVKVTVIDKNKRRVTAWNSKHLPIYEPELNNYVRATRDGTCDGTCGYKCHDFPEDDHENIHAANLSFTTSTEALKTADIIFVAVDTSCQVTAGSTTSLDMSNFTSAMKDVAEHARPGTIVVEKSTLPCYPDEQLHIKYGFEVLTKLQEKDVEILYIPEFLAEGTAIRNLLFPDRIVIGCEATLRGMQAARTLGDIYAQWVRNERILIMELGDAQISKLAANAMLASKITAINSISVLCERVGADIDVVSSAVGMDPRIGSGYLQAGLGFGGTCLPKDLLTLVQTASYQHVPHIANYWSNQYDMTAVEVTELVLRLAAALGTGFDDKRITILGYAHKTGTSDVRGSLALRVVRAILKTWADSLHPTMMPKCNLDHKDFSVVVNNKWMEYDEVATSVETAPAEIEKRLMTGPHGVQLAIFDPFCWPEDIKGDLEACLGSLEPNARRINIYRDVHEACSKSDAIIVLTSYWSNSGPSPAPGMLLRCIAAKKQKQRLKRQKGRPPVIADEIAALVKLYENRNESTLKRKRSPSDSGQYMGGTESPKKQRQDCSAIITKASPDSGQGIGPSDSDTRSPKRKVTPGSDEGYSTLSETSRIPRHGCARTVENSKRFDEVHFSDLMKQGSCPGDCERCRDDVQRFESYLDWSLVATRMRGAKVVYDVPRVLDEVRMKQLGLRVETLGRKHQRYQQQKLKDGEAESGDL